MNWALLKSSLLVSGGTMLLAPSLGLVAALFVAGLPRGWQKVSIGLGLLVLAMPPFVVTDCWLYLLGPTGVWRGWLPLDIMSLGGAVWILSLMLWPISMLAALAAWNRLEPRLLESDMAVRGRLLIRYVLFPLARGSVAQAAVLTFVLALNNFAVPAILQVQVYPAQLWIRFSTTFDILGAWRLSWPMLLAPVLLLAWFGSRGLRWPKVQNPVTAGLWRRQLGSHWIAYAAVATVCLFALSACLPLFQIMGQTRTWRELPGAVAAGQSAIWGSLGLAFAAACVITLVGLFRMPRFGVDRPNRRVNRFSRWVGLGMWVPFLLPGVLVGTVLLAVLNRGWFTAIYSSVWVVILAYGIRYFAPGRALIREGLKLVDPALVDVARLEGANRWQTVRRVLWPQVAPQVAVAWYVVFVLCLWDVESMIMVVPPGVETLALRIFNLLHYGHNSQVDALCVVLLGLAVAPLLFWTAGAWARNQMHGSFRLGLRCGVVTCGMVVLALTGCTPTAEPVAELHSRIFESVRTIGTRGAGVGQLNKPRSVAVDLEDNLYTVDMTGRVQKFSSNGVFLLSWQMPQTDLGKPKGMCRDRAGNIVVLEPHYARVNHFSPAGKMVAQWGRHGTNDGMLSVPRAVAVNARDEVFITEYQQAERVQKFVWNREAQQSGAAPQWVASFGKAGSGPGEFNRPEGMCVDGEGLVYVADSCNHRIQVFTSEGRFVRSFGKAGKGAGELSYPYDVCVDSSGREYVCEFGNSRIQVFDAQGRSLEIIGGPGGEPGRFSNPWGVALDSAGNLYVADSQNHRVQKLMRSRRDVLDQPSAVRQTLAPRASQVEPRA